LAERCGVAPLQSVRDPTFRRTVEGLSKIIATGLDRFDEVRVYSYWTSRVVAVREFCKEEVVMQETKRIADEANRMGQQYQERIQSGFEAASRSFTEANQGFQALAAEMMQYSKAGFDDATRTWEQLIGVRTLEAAVAIQSDYAKRTYENHMAELKKLGEMCVGMVRDASKPVEDVSRKFR
jgi:phasin family protein